MDAVIAHPSLQPEKSTIVRAENKPPRMAPPWLRTGLAHAGRVAPELTSAVVAKLFRTTRRFTPRSGEREVLTTATSSELAGMQLWSWGEGPTVLLVHGWNGRATQLGGFVEPLVARGYHVVAFDALGHGDSRGRTSSLPELANCIRQVAEELGGVHAIIAHSLGGAATTYAIAHGLRVERAVFISPPADPHEFLKLFGSALGISDAVRERVQRRVERRLGVSMDDMVAYGFAPSMDTPLLVIHDEDDREVPVEAGAQIARMWPGAELTVTAGLGHQRILRDEAVRDAAVRFVDVAVRSLRAA